MLYFKFEFQAHFAVTSKINKPFHKIPNGDFLLEIMLPITYIKQPRTEHKNGKCIKQIC